MTTTRQTPTRRITRVATILLALALLATLLPTAVVGAVGADTPTADASIETAAPTIQEGENDTNASEGTPTIAENVRVTPETFDEDHLQVETIESDEVYNTTGPFATFSLSEPVESARLEQTKADARLMGDGSTIRVEYDDDAAGENASLYTVELFFEDDSSHTIELYASDTDVTVTSAELIEYEDYIQYSKTQAEEAGFEPTPEGVTSYLENREERADFLDHMFTEHVMMFISLLLAAAQNFVFWVVAIAIIAALAIYFERKHGWILRLQQMAESRAELMREAVRQDYEERRNAAAKHALEDISEIGPNAARYWRELGVETVDDMIEIACKGILKVDRDGRIEYDDDGNPIYAHHGVNDLKEVEPLTLDQLRSQTWLQPLILEGRLTPTTALSNIESALLVAEKEYNRGNEVRETRRTVGELIARLSGDRDYEHAETSSNAARTDNRPTGGPTPAGGD